MIDPTLLHHLDDAIAGLLAPVVEPDGRVRFQPPDSALGDFIQTLALGAGVLNVYLAEIREARDIRTPEWESVPLPPDGVQRRPPPAFVDVHYVITAWTRAQAAGNVDVARDQHGLLYRVLAALFAAAPLNLERLLGGSAPAGVPSDIFGEDLRTVVAPPDDSPKLRDFWATMGADARWKPAVHLIVTVPVVLPLPAADGVVRAIFTEYPDARGEVLEQVGVAGVIQTVVGGASLRVGGAVVTLAVPGGPMVQTATTDQDGAYAIRGIPPGTYDLRVTSTAYRPATKRGVEIPTGTTDCDITLI